MVCRCHDMFCTCNTLVKVDASKLDRTSKLNDSEILQLYGFLKHGSEDHQEWLLKSLFHYFKGTDLPDYKS